MNEFFYKKLIKNISESIKSTINKNMPYYEKDPNNNITYLQYVCDKYEKNEICRIAKENDFEEYIDDGNARINIEIEISLGGTNIEETMTGTLYGEMVYSIDNNENQNLSDYELFFTDNNTNKEYLIFLSYKDAAAKIPKNYYDTPVKRAYDQKIAVQKRIDDYQEDIKRNKQWAEEKKRKDAENAAYEKDCLNNPEKYIKIALNIENDYENRRIDYSKLDTAEKIYNILGLTYEAKRIHDITTSEYHREESRYEF